MPMAAGCEGNLLLEAAGCGLFLCQRLPDVSVVVQLGFDRLGGVLTTPHPSSSVATVSRCAPLPSQNFYLRFWESGVCPAGGCRMWTKLLPEAGGCNLMFLPEAAGGGQNFCRRLGSSMDTAPCITTRRARLGVCVTQSSHALGERKERHADPRDCWFVEAASYCNGGV